MARFAERTKVPVNQSRSEIERTLDRYGATGFLYGKDGLHVQVMFRMSERLVRINLLMPEDSVTVRREQEERRLWRALLLVLKAKLEAVESGITTFEQEFLAHIVMPDNRTVAEHVLPKVNEAYLTGKTPKLLTSGD